MKGHFERVNYQESPFRIEEAFVRQCSLKACCDTLRSSNYAAPVIIDNPLGLFSDEHRTAITKYLPHLSKQVIFMVSTGDLTEKYRDILSPFVKTEYYLANESSGTWSKTTIASWEEHK